MVAVILRRREDSWWDAGQKRTVELGATPHPDAEPDRNRSKHFLAMLENPAFEAAQPGDVWQIRLDPADERTQSARLRTDWPTVIGYVLWCPNESCKQGVHPWTHAHSCNAPFEPCKNGGPSCWTWTGSIEGNDLSAHPSLHCDASLGGCGWHGYLRNGEMQSV